MKVVVAIPASFEGICISGSNKTDNKNFTDFQSGGSVSDNAGHSYGFQLIDEIAEWDDETSDRYGNEGKYSIEYYLDGESQGVSYPAWSKPTQHSAGLKDDSSFYITIPTYGTHEVKAVLTGNDGSTCEKSIQLTTTPLWFTAPNVTKVSANAGDVVIPDTLNGKTVSALKGNSASDGVQAGVTSLTIPDSVTSIDAAFFAKAVDLTQINFLGDVPNGNLDLSNVALTDGSIQVPSEYLQDYLQTAAAQWNKGDCPLSWEEIFNVDTEAPIVEVHYSNSELTNADVVVTLKVNEQIETPQGWTKVSETAYTKVFSENGEETVELKDLAGNVTTVNVVVSNIDKSAPQLFVEDQSIRQGESFDPMAIVSAKDGDVDLSDRVTFEGEVDVQTPGVYTLTYSVSDAAGNTTEKTIQVTVLSSVQDPEDEVKDEEGEKEEETDSVDTGVFAQEGMAAISLLGAALGVTLLSAKKRRTNEQR